MSTVSDRAADAINVEVAYALPDRQSLLRLSVPEGTTVEGAIELSGIRDEYPGLEVGAIGIFSQKTSLDQVLREGDRVEIYRPLVADPREMRKKRARNEKSGG
jgi:hypothetical protein